MNSRSTPNQQASIFNGLRTLMPRIAGHPRVVRLGMSLWPPFWGAGIKVKRIAPDWRSATVQLCQRPWNMNYVGTHFGGSLFAMTDPFWMMMVMHSIGPGHIVWDKSGEIEFRKPGRGTLSCHFILGDAQLAELSTAVATHGKATRWFAVDILDEAGETVATVRKEVYVRAKGRSPQKT